MAEDKKIRISADLSQLRSLREEATGLQRDLNSLSNSSSPTDDSIAKLKEQLALLGQRNDLEEMYNDLRKEKAAVTKPSPSPQAPSSSGNIEREPPAETNTSGWREPPVVEKARKRLKKFTDRAGRNLSDDSDEFLDPPAVEEQESERIPRELPDFTERSEKSITDATSDEEMEEAAKRYHEEQDHIKEAQENLPLGDDMVYNLTTGKREKRKYGRRNKPTLDSQDETAPIELPVQDFEPPTIPPPDQDFEPPIIPPDQGSQIISPDPDPDWQTTPPVQDFEPPTIPPDQGSGDSGGSGDIDLLAFLEGWKSQLSAENGRQWHATLDIESLAEEIKQLLETGKSNDDNEPTPPSNPPTTPGQDGGGGNGTTGGRNGALPNARSIAGQVAGGGLLLQMMNYAFGKLQEGIQIITNRHLRTLTIGEQKDYLSPISSVSSYTSYKGKQEADPYRIIPILGSIAAGEIEAVAEAKAQKQSIGLSAAAQLETQVRPYAQTFGVSNGRAVGEAFREGGYAAGSLGLDVGQYSEKRAQLVRAGGGVDKVSGLGESQSLMAVERLYGLNPSATSQLQGSMRFSEKDSDTTNSSSSVIRIFEQTMRDLKKPFSEIASTMEESLSTFNRSAESILAKTGDFDAAKVAGVLAGIRAYTGAEGKQLERYQESFSGQVISQDEVTQALLLRTVTKMDSSVKTYSDAMSKIEKIQEDPGAMKDFLKGLQSLTQTNEQFINVLKAVFPKLSYSDIKEQVEKPGFSIDALFDKIMASTKKLQQDNDKKNQYERDAASKTIGTIESANAVYQNQMKGYGASISGDISKIRGELEKIAGSLNAKDGLDKAAEVIGNAFEVVGGKIMQATKNGGAIGNWAGMQGAQVFAIGKLIEQMFKEKD